MLTSTQKSELIDLAVNGNKDALEKLLVEVQDFVFNISLRMLGTLSDAEDASQEIFVRIITNLSSFRKDSDFSTWVYRISVNYLLNYKKSMFYRYPLSFDFYGEDIKNGTCNEMIDHTGGVDKDILANELKMSCTNIMLQCFDPESRCIFVLGTMFKINSNIVGEVLEMSPENFRKKLSRTRKKMAEFLSSYCGLTDTGICSCKKRINYAIEQHRLNPKKLEFHELEILDEEILVNFKKEMEKLDDLSLIFDCMPEYKVSNSAKEFIHNLLKSKHMKVITQYT